MKRPQSILPALTMLAVVLASCEGEGPGETTPMPVVFEPASSEDGVAESTDTVADVMAGWTRVGDWLVSPPSRLLPGATRVGALVELAAAGPLPAIEAQAHLQGQPAGDFVALEATWSEDVFHVAVAELPTPGDSARIRIAVADIDWILSIQWSAVAPAGDDPGAPATGAVTSALSPDLQGAGIVTREQWGARATKCGSKDGARSRIAIHYTDTPSDKSATRVRAIQAYHMDTKGWCDIGYHFLVAVDGTVYEGRPSQYVGAHVANHNTGTLGVSFIGCFQPGACSGMGPQDPPDAAIESGGKLLGILSDVFGVSVDAAHVMGHRDFPGASTDCPGDNLEARIPDMRAIAGASGQPPADTAPDVPDVVKDVPDVPADAPVDTQPDTGPYACPGLACATCEAKAGCEWCAAHDACVGEGASCAWQGLVGASACWDQLWPCWVATCWNPTLDAAGCADTVQDEDFSSGKYSVHRYWTTLPAVKPVTVRLERTAGTFAPALLITDRQGNAAFGGEAAPLHPSIHVVSAKSGRTGGVAEAVVAVAAATDVYVYVTGWSVLDAGFSGKLPTSSRYRLTLSQDCGTKPPPTGFGETETIWTCDGTVGTKRNAAGGYYVTSFGCWTDAGGTPHQDPGDNCIPWCMSGADGQGQGAAFDALCGGMSGPDCEESLNWFCADADRFGCGNRLRVTNPANGKSAIVAVIDRGPSCSVEDQVDHWVLDLSYPATDHLFGEPKAATEKGLVTVEEVPIATPLGPE